MKAVKKGDFDFPKEEWDVVSDVAKDLIKKMLTYDPKKRVSALDCLAHDFFKQNHLKEINNLNKLLYHLS